MFAEDNRLVQTALGLHVVDEATVAERELLTLVLHAASADPALRAATGVSPGGKRLDGVRGSSRSRCNGTDEHRGGGRRRRGWFPCRGRATQRCASRCRAYSRTAVPWAANVSAIRCRSSSSTPSSVVIRRRRLLERGLHEMRALPSINTVQHLHWPDGEQSFGEVIRNSSRRAADDRGDRRPRRSGR